MLDRLSRGRRNFVLAVLGLLVVWFGWSIRAVLNPLLIGYLCAYILHPLVLRVEQLGLSRRAAVNAIFAIGLVAAVGLGWVMTWQVRGLATDVITDPQVRDRVQTQVESFETWVEDKTGFDFGETTVPDLFEKLRPRAKELLAGHEGQAVQQAGGALGHTYGVVSRFVGRSVALAGAFLLVPLYAYFLLFELGRLHAFVRRYVPKRERERASRIGGQVGEVLANFFRGRLSVCFLKGLFLSVGLMIAGIDYAFLFGMTSGFLALVPFVGPLIGFLFAAMVGLLDHGVFGTLLRTGIVFGLAEVLEGYVLIPKILGDSLGLHPVVVLFAMLAGGSALGMLGILIALPLTASLVILIRELVLPALQAWADEDPSPTPDDAC
jgi:predicted PurR-regulated permease PerM